MEVSIIEIGLGIAFLLVSAFSACFTGYQFGLNRGLKEGRAHGFEERKMMILVAMEAKGILDTCLVYDGRAYNSLQDVPVEASTAEIEVWFSPVAPDDNNEEEEN